MVYGKCEMMAEYICYGVLYIAEATIAWLYFDALFCRKSSGLRIGITCAVAYLLLFGITWFNSVVLNGAAFFLSNLLLLWMNYECKLRSAILHSAFLTSIMAITEIIAAWIISLFGFRFGAYADSLAIMIVMAVISKMLYFSITVIAAKLWAPNRQAQEEPAFMGLLCILPIFSVIVSAVVVYIGVRAEMTKPVELLMIIIVLTLLIVNLIFMVIYNHLQRMHAEQLAMNLSIQKEEADAAYYQDLQKQSENQRILIHDIKRHLNTIHGLANDFNAPGISEYITKLVDDVLPDQQVKLCSDPILNFMLQQFRDKCKSQKITLQCDIRDNCLSFMDAPSITTFYGNLLTNAFEAASSSAERMIELSVKKNEDQQVVIVSVVNSCDTPPVPDHEGLFRTKKRNPGIHGVGLKSIGRIVARYHGVATMRFDPESKKFYHLIVFPAVHIAGVAPHGHQDRLLEIRPVQPAVVDGDFRRRSGIQTVQQLRIGKEHLLLVLTACHKVVDVGELIGFGKAAAHLKNTVLPDAADGDHILHLAGYGVPLLVLFQQVFQRFDHDFPPSNLSLSAS